MHSYVKHIGDYNKKAGRLNLLQHGVYNQLMDACYDREDFPTREEAYDWVWASTTEEIEAVDFVLRKFFTEDENGKFVQKRINEALNEYRDFCEKQALNGRKGGRPKKPSGNNKKPSGFSENPSGNPVATHRGRKKTLTDNLFTDNQLKEKYKKENWEIPNWLNLDAFREFENYRSSILKKPITAVARTKLANRLRGFSASEQQDAVDKSIENNWTGLFPEKAKNETRQQSDKPESHHQKITRLIHAGC